MRHNRKANYDIMEEWIESNKGGIVIINGDFNARTAKEGGLWDRNGERENRESKDETINEEGKEMVSWMEQQGLGIANGATVGDENGEWTQIEPRGCTTIDYTIRNEIGKECIEILTVANSIKSDHLPLELRVKWKMGRSRREKERRGETKVKMVVKWDENSVKDYRDKLKKYGGTGEAEGKNTSSPSQGGGKG